MDRVGSLCTKSILWWRCKVTETRILGVVVMASGRLRATLILRHRAGDPLLNTRGIGRRAVLES